MQWVLRVCFCEMKERVKGAGNAVVESGGLMSLHKDRLVVTIWRGEQTLPLRGDEKQNVEDKILNLLHLKMFIVSRLPCRSPHGLTV